MPTVTLNKDVFEKLVGKKLPIEQLKDRISYIGTDLEKIEGNEIHVEVFPNRPDMLSEQGFARALSSFIGVKTGLRPYAARPSGHQVVVDKSVAAVRPYTVCAIVRGLRLDDEKIREIIQIQEKLHVTFCRNRRKAAIGIYPFEKIKTPIRYLAKKPSEIVFQPLEFSKATPITKILEEHPAGKAYGHLLEGKKLYPVFVDANNEVLSVPPIINSHKTGRITSETKDVFIECSGFDIDALGKLLNIIVSALADMGGEIQSMQIAYPDKTITTPDLSPSKMKLDIPYINGLLGISLGEKECAGLLERMGYSYNAGYVMVPAYRADILHQADLAEDIAIAYGYERFTAQIPQVATTGKEDELAVFSSKLARMLVGLGFLETNTTTVTSKEHQTTRMRLQEKELPLALLKNSVTVEANCLKAWLLPGMLEIYATNRHHDFPQKLFELGRIAHPSMSRAGSANDTGVDESRHLVVSIAHNKADFTQIKQVIDYVFQMLALSYTLKPASHASFIPGRVGTAVVGKVELGTVGELHPDVLRNFNIETPVVAFEIDVASLFGILR